MKRKNMDGSDVQEGGIESVAMSIAQLAHATSLGRTSLYKAVRLGQLRACKFGRRTLILRADFEEFLAKLRQK